MMTGTSRVSGSPLSVRQTSKPSGLKPSNVTSSSTRSGCAVFTSSETAPGSPVSTTRQPWLDSVIRTSSRMWFESSAMRTVGTLGRTIAARPSESVSAPILALVDATAVDLTAPRPGGGATRLDEALETFEIAAHATLEEAQCVPDLFARVARAVRELERDPCLAIAGGLKDHRPGVHRAGNAAPRDVVVRDLIGDLGLPLLVLPGDVGAPAKPLLVQLHDLLDALHEFRER